MTQRILLLLLVLMLSAPGTALAFLGFGEDRGQENSGLDLKQGYDVNTVVTLTGRVSALPQVTAQKDVLIEMKSGDQTLYLAVGPANFWEKSGMAVKVNDELTVKGSRAQGKDGREYLMAQKISLRGRSSQIELRDPQGNALWSGHSAMGGRENSFFRGGAGRGFRGPDAGGMLRGGDMMRGGGMMGGGMRR